MLGCVRLALSLVLLCHGSAAFGVGHTAAFVTSNNNNNNKLHSTVTDAPSTTNESSTKNANAIRYAYNILFVDCNSL